MAKGSIQLTTGIGLSCLFIATMDDFVYGDFKRNVIMPMQMIQVKSQTNGYSAADAQALAEGTGRFVKKFKPSAITPESAKELLLKDSEYSTP